MEFHRGIDAYVFYRPGGLDNKEVSVEAKRIVIMSIGYGNKAGQVAATVTDEVCDAIKLECLSGQCMLAARHLRSRRVGLIPSPSRSRCKYESDAS